MGRCIRTGVSCSVFCMSVHTETGINGKQSKTPLKGYPITVKTEARQPFSLLAAGLVGWVTRLWFTCYKLHQKSHGFIFL